MKEARSIAVLFTCVCMTLAHAQHTPLTTQYLFNGLTINPAYAGARDALTANLMHRQQWVGFAGAPVTQTMSVHAPLDKSKLGLGLLLYSDGMGVSRETGVFGNVAYRMKLPHGRLGLGLGVGATMVRGAWNEVALQDQSDVVFAAPTRSALRPNFSTGAFYYNKRAFIGLSAPFLLTHRVRWTSDGYSMSEVQGDLEPMLTAGRVFDLNKDLKLKPSFLARYRTATGAQADLTATAIYKERISLGASYRTNDAVIAMLEVQPTPQWRIGYAYDMGLNSLRAHHLGSHEIFLQYELGFRIRARDPRYF
jgi:type IX secretion system PorP/SprF family membrane protein